MSGTRKDTWVDGGKHEPYTGGEIVSFSWVSAMAGSFAWRFLARRRLWSRRLEV